MKRTSVFFSDRDYVIFSSGALDAGLSHSRYMEYLISKYPDLAVCYDSPDQGRKRRNMSLYTVQEIHDTLKRNAVRSRCTLGEYLVALHLIDSKERENT